MTVLLWIVFGMMAVGNIINILTVSVNWSMLKRKGRAGVSFLGIIAALFCLTVVFFAALL